MTMLKRNVQKFARLMFMVKAHRILSKSEIMPMDYLNFVLEAAASSAKFGLVTEWQPGGNIGGAGDGQKQD